MDVDSFQHRPLPCSLRCFDKMQKLLHPHQTPWVPSQLPTCSKYHESFGNWMKHGEIVGWDFVSEDYSISQTLGVSRMTCSCMSRASSSSLSASTACCAYRKLMRANKYMCCTNANFNKNIYKPWYWLFMKLLLQVDMDIRGLHSTLLTLSIENHKTIS